MTNELRHVREDAQDVLRDALSWRLTSTRWVSVADTVVALRTALRAGDALTARDLVLELELQGPVRATRIDGEPIVLAPDTIRPVLNSLVDALAEDESDAPEGRG